MTTIQEYAAKHNVTLTDEQAEELQKLHERYQAIGWPNLTDHILSFIARTNPPRREYIQKCHRTMDKYDERDVK